MAKIKVPETFRCHIHIKGEQCPCEMTLVNTFVYTLATLDRKAQAAGKIVEGKFLAENAMCPWHARFLAKIRRDVVRMDNVVNLVLRRESYARTKAAMRQEWKKQDQFLKDRMLAYQPRLGAALILAGVASLEK